MKRIRSGLVMLLLLSLMTSVIAAGCQSNGTTKSNEAQAASAQSSGGGKGVPSYLNMGTDGPMVKSGNKTPMNVVVSQTPQQASADKIWLWEYFRKAHNIDIKVEQVTDTNEYKKLAFASGDIPDVLMNMGITTAELVNYGMGEKMFLKVDEYIDPYMPNLAAIYAKNPGYKGAVSAPDGHIYGLGMISDPNDETRATGYNINKKWLEELKLKMPATVDEFVAVLRAFRDNYKGAVAFNGGYKASNPCQILLTAYGWLTTDAKGISVALRNGKVVFPYGDQEVYGAYLKTMNTLYKEKLMSQDFYTLDDAAVNANVSLGIAGTYSGAPYTANSKVFADWWSPKPLVSAYNNKQIWPARDNALDCGKFVISASYKYPELACKLADFWYDEKGMVLASYGPMAGSNVDTYGMTSGWKWSDKANWIQYDDIINDTKNLYNGMEFNYRMLKICAYSGVNFGDIRDFFGAVARVAGSNYKRVWTLDNPDFYNYAAREQNIKPFYTETYPGNVFFDKKTNDRVNELKTSINAYVESETAKFVTGARAIDDNELKKYFSQLEALGYQEYLKYYVDYYTKNKAK